jgi:hypothetical protein
MSNFLTASVSVGSSAYVDLGVGPLEVGYNSGPGVSLVVADEQPAATLTGTILGGAPPKLSFWQTTHVWAISIEAEPSTLNVTPTAAGAPGTAAQGMPATAADAWPVVLTDPAGVNQADVNSAHQVAVQLPPGAAQDGTDATGVTAPAGGAGVRGWLSGIYAKLSGALAVTGTFWQTTQPVSAAALPLPSGAATAAKQPALDVDGGAAAHVTNFPATQAIDAASGALAVGAAADGWNVTEGAQAEAAWSSGDGSVIALLKAIAGALATVFSYTNIAASTSTVVKAAPGVFAGLVVNAAGTGSSAVVYDNTTATGTVIATFDTAAAGARAYPPTAALIGISVLTADSGSPADITVLWR